MCASSCLRRCNKHGLSPWRSCARDFAPPQATLLLNVPPGATRPFPPSSGRRGSEPHSGRPGPGGAGDGNKGGAAPRRLPRAQTPRKRPARAGHGRPRSGAALGSGKRSPRDAARREGARGPPSRRLEAVRERRRACRHHGPRAAPSAPSGGAASWGSRLLPVPRGFGLGHGPGRVPSGPDKMEAPELN